jgi:tRNA 2-thiouridine synthesizing protein A
MNEAIAKSLDASGLMCPEPVMLLHKIMREVEAGNLIEVIATDPSTLRDIPKFCLFLGHELADQKDIGDRYYFYIRKK